MFIELKKVRKIYALGATEVVALKSIDLTLERGEFAALVGTSGSGKTTLLNMIGCIDRPTSGDVMIDGVNVVALGENQLSDFRNQKLGFIFQSFNLLPVLNIYENVELPLLIQKDLTTSERRDRVLQAIEDVELSRFKRHVPDRLSGGQRQRVAIARALVTHPSLILADEPTANLDSETAHKILNLMQTLNDMRKVTFLFSTHDEKLMSRVRRIIRIVDGHFEA
jgi:putative ABC transport system ATP-binding protein